MILQLNLIFFFLTNHLLAQAICNTAKEIAKPIIAQNIEKFKIESVEFEALTLGTLPPTFQG